MEISYIVVLMYKKSSQTSYNKVKSQVYANDEYSAVAKACRFFGEMGEEIEDVIVISVDEDD